jgi:hypothetical protein
MDKQLAAIRWTSASLFVITFTTFLVTGFVASFIQPSSEICLIISCANNTATITSSSKGIEDIGVSNCEDLEKDIVFTCYDYKGKTYIDYPDNPSTKLFVAGIVNACISGVFMVSTITLFVFRYQLSHYFENRAVEKRKERTNLELEVVKTLD